MTIKLLPVINREIRMKEGKFIGIYHDCPFCGFGVYVEKSASFLEIINAPILTRYGHACPGTGCGAMFNLLYSWKEI